MKDLNRLKREISNLLWAYPRLVLLAGCLYKIAVKSHSLISALSDCFSGHLAQLSKEKLVVQIHEYHELMLGLNVVVKEADLNENEKKALNGILGMIILSAIGIEYKIPTDGGEA